MEIFQLKSSSVSISGDYYQIIFDDDFDSIDKPYFLVQCDLEFPNKECYIECKNKKLISHYLVNSIDIDDRSFTIRYGASDIFVVRIEYQANNEEQCELIHAATAMFDKVNIIN
ncbi:MAG: hypothetical protein QNK36_08775 [Colwellia sp.]|nr:hypothetical protein [Colwellia sp.]